MEIHITFHKAVKLNATQGKILTLGKMLNLKNIVALNSYLIKTVRVTLALLSNLRLIEMGD